MTSFTTEIWDPNMLSLSLKNQFPRYIPEHKIHYRGQSAKRSVPDKNSPSVSPVGAIVASEPKDVSVNTSAFSLEGTHDGSDGAQVDSSNEDGGYRSNTSFGGSAEITPPPGCSPIPPLQSRNSMELDAITEQKTLERNHIHRSKEDLNENLKTLPILPSFDIPIKSVDIHHALLDKNHRHHASFTIGLDPLVPSISNSNNINNNGNGNGIASNIATPSPTAIRKHHNFLYRLLHPSSQNSETSQSPTPNSLPSLSNNPSTIFTNNNGEITSITSDSPSPHDGTHALHRSSSFLAKLFHFTHRERTSTPEISSPSVSPYSSDSNSSTSLESIQDVNEEDRAVIDGVSRRSSKDVGSKDITNNDLLHPESNANSHHHHSHDHDHDHSRSHSHGHSRSHNNNNNNNNHKDKDENSSTTNSTTSPVSPTNPHTFDFESDPIGIHHEGNHEGDHDGNHHHHHHHHHHHGLHHHHHLHHHSHHHSTTTTAHHKESTTSPESSDNSDHGGSKSTDLARDSSGEEYPISIFKKLHKKTESQAPDDSTPITSTNTTTTTDASPHRKEPVFFTFRRLASGNNATNLGFFHHEFGVGGGSNAVSDQASSSPSPSSASQTSSHQTQLHHNNSSLFKDLITTKHRRSFTGTDINKKELSSLSNTGNGLQRSNSDVSLQDKYGKVEEVLGKGANAVVKLIHKSSTPAFGTVNDKYFAVKEFRKRRKDETQKDYIKKILAEFCISSSMHHENVIQTVDLIQDDNKWCEIMEYMPGGDLYGRIFHGTLTDPDEINCFFKQLIHGIAYIHSMGVAHRDLKPENLLLNEPGYILKITDFGVSEVFRTCFEKAPRRIRGLCGSEPYIAPEEFEPDAEYDPTKVDVWAAGIIYYTMMFSSVPWRAAKKSDPYFEHYLKCLRHNSSSSSSSSSHARFPLFDRYPPLVRDLIYKMLDPDPNTRYSIEDVLQDPWFVSVDYCTEREPSTTHLHRRVAEYRIKPKDVVSNKQDENGTSGTGSTGTGMVTVTGTGTSGAEHNAGKNSPNMSVTKSPKSLSRRGSSKSLLKMAQSENHSLVKSSGGDSTIVSHNTATSTITTTGAIATTSSTNPESVHDEIGIGISGLRSDRNGSSGITTTSTHSSVIEPFLNVNDAAKSLELMNQKNENNMGSMTQHRVPEELETIIESSGGAAILLGTSHPTVEGSVNGKDTPAIIETVEPRSSASKKE